MRVLTTLFLFFYSLTNLSAQMINFTSSCDTIYFCTSENDCGPALVELTTTATTACNTGTITMNYSIDLNNDGTIDNTGMGNVHSDNYSVGSHRAIFTATDDCSNETVCEFLFLVEDCTPPLAMVYEGLNIETLENCEAILYATDMNNGSSDNCGINNMLLVNPSQGPGQTAPPANASSSLSFNGCTDLGTQILDFWVSDDAGNWSYISTYILVQDNLAPFCSCASPGMICFYSETECGESVGEVTYVINAPGIPDLNNGCDPSACLEGLPMGTNVVVVPEKNINPLNGVSTFDLLLIAKHILQIDLLDSPYKIIAADASNNGMVTTIDLVDIRKLVLGINTDFPNNTSWRFVDEDYVFPNPQNPFQSTIPQACTVNWVYEEIDKTFIGIKIGDVNKSVNPDLFVDPDIDSRTNFAFTFELMDQSFEAGETITIDFRTTDIDQYSGFQFDLEFDTDYLAFEEIKKGHLKHLEETNFGLGKTDQGIIAASWINSDFTKIEKTEEALFTLQFKALQAGSLKDIIKITDSRLSPEAYTNELNISDLNIHFLEAVPKTELSLQNTPNPFQQETVVQFELLQAEEVTLEVMNVEGKVIQVIRQTAEKGLNKIRLNESLFPSNGVYFYRLQTSTEDITEKLLKF